MKGISPIIAIIIILLITIAIAGAAYSYITIIWGRTTQGLQLVSADCTGGMAQFVVRNVGTNDMTAITVTRTSPITGTADQIPVTIVPGETDTINDTACGANNMCVYKVFAGGQAQELYIQCGSTLSPIISNGQVVPLSGPPGTIFTITADISDPQGVDPATTKAHIQDPDEADVVVVDLYDDGLHSDGGAGDGTYGEAWDSTGVCVAPLGCAYFIDIVACDMLGTCGEAENI